MNIYLQHHLQFNYKTGQMKGYLWSITGANKCRYMPKAMTEICSILITLIYLLQCLIIHAINNY